MSDTPTLTDVMAELAALEDTRMRAVNQAHGNDHGVNLSKLRDLAKRLKTQHQLALELWATGDSAARLLAMLVARPKAYSAAELDIMVQDITSTKLLDWFVSYQVKPGKHAEELRLKWKDQPGFVGRAGWSLTTDRVVKSPEGLDLAGLLDQIEAEMKGADAVKQWNMNHTLAEIGIRFAPLRARARAIGERLEVLKDYPTPPNCTSPYAPIWIDELVRRREG